jgi:hypothetical protein
MDPTIHEDVQGHLTAYARGLSDGLGYFTEPDLVRMARALSFTIGLLDGLDFPEDTAGCRQTQAKIERLLLAS